MTWSIFGERDAGLLGVEPRQHELEVDALHVEAQLAHAIVEGGPGGGRGRVCRLSAQAPAVTQFELLLRLDGQFLPVEEAVGRRLAVVAGRLEA